MFSRSLLLAATVAAGSARAGAVLQTVNRDLDGKRAETITTTYAQDGRLRIEASDHDGFSIFKNDALYVVNSRDKNYVVMNRATLKKMADALSPVLKLLEQMPPEQRAQMEHMMGKNVPSASKQVVRKTSRTGKAAGHSCSYVEILEGGTLSDELCVVETTSLKGGDELMAAAQRMSAMLQEVFKGLDAPQLKQLVDQQTATYTKVGGIPVVSRHFANGKAVSETTLKENRSETIPATMFEVPSGYTRKEFMPGR